MIGHTKPEKGKADHSTAPRNRINIKPRLVTAGQCEEAGGNFSGVSPV
jgi:hypothetical protein